MSGKIPLGCVLSLAAINGPAFAAEVVVLDRIGDGSWVDGIPGAYATSGLSDPLIGFGMPGTVFTAPVDGTLMTFTASVYGGEFSGTGRHVIRQVGNAVPPLFAALLGQHIAKFVFDRKELLTHSEMVERLDIGFLR